ncbi:hypothetical protein [Sphingobacterium paucimobilis]|uniref:DUF4595 domain-containing protein n=1 Tax=Sphingobacterium paucimobilis HER1398 TaxID=1346330 RepID=U2HHB3_9SPHI|nr:hypothetical protein [Sphingobacterium paucimobilis]ERJ61136.1 hypothetical protein M472_20505 [Sphingobacterium paucimobilis HER1398]
MKYFVLFLFLCAGLNYSCKKDTEDSLSIPIFSKIDRLEFHYTAPSFGPTLIDDIVYDEKGRIIGFQGESYQYNNAGKVTKIDVKIEPSEFVNSADHYWFDLTYDHLGRFKSISDVQFKEPSSSSEGGMYIRPGVESRSYSLGYGDNSSLPSTIDCPHAVYTSGVQFPSGFEKGTSVGMFEHKKSNIVAEKMTVKGKVNGKWNPEAEEIEIKSNRSFSYDSSYNVYMFLFGSLGFVPKEVEKALSLEPFVIYNKNNMVNVEVDGKSMNIDYMYDEQRRIKEIKRGHTTLKIFYKI